MTKTSQEFKNLKTAKTTKTAKKCPRIIAKNTKREPSCSEAEPYLAYV